MLSIQTQSNYLAKIVKVEGLQKHPNADKLQIVNIDFQQVITGMDTKEGDVVVYFPLECSINSDFLSQTNSYRHKELNKNQEEVGFFEDKGRVRAVRLRGEKSMGYIVPIIAVNKFVGAFDYELNQEFDTINDVKMCKKFVVVTKTPRLKEGKKPRISRIVEGQVHLHAETENLRKNAHKISTEDEISVSYKVHGTSWWVSNVIGKKKLGVINKFLKFIGVDVRDVEYDFFYGSRKVVKNEFETQGTNDWYGEDLWGEIKEEVKDKIPFGFTLYGEAIGYTKGGKEIQKGYDYGCALGEIKLMVYRITQTNANGLVIDLSTSQMQEFCKKVNLPFIHLFYKGKAKDMYPEIDTQNHWQEEWIKRLEKDYNDKDCFMCSNKVPEEGIVVRKEMLFGFEAYKLKSFRFLERETILLDEGNINLEDNA